MKIEKESKKFFIIREKLFKHSEDIIYVDSSSIHHCRYYVWWGESSKQKSYTFSVGNNVLENAVIIQQVGNSIEIKIFNNKYIIGSINFVELHAQIENLFNTIILDIISFMNNSSEIIFNINDHIAMIFSNFIEKLQNKEY